MKELVKTPTSRNLWTIMKEFNTLPTNPDFQKLTEDQVEFIMYNLDLDAEQRKMAMEGINPNEHFSDSDDSWWNDSHEEFNPLEATELTEDEIADKVTAMTTAEDLHRLEESRRENEDWANYLEEQGIDEKETYTSHTVQSRLDSVYEEARRLEQSGKSNWGKKQITEEEEQNKHLSETSGELTSEGIDEAIRLFEGESLDNFEEEFEEGPDDGWI